MGKSEETEEGEEDDWEETVSDRKRAGIYVRVSTTEQDTGLQETELREYCERRGWESILYRDRGQSGAKQDRPALNSLLRELRQRRVDVILVWSLDRLARSLKQLLNIAEECKSLGVDLVSLRQNIDTTLPAGRLMFQVLGAIGEFERELLRERVKAGMAQARRAGKRIGRPALRHFSPGERERVRSLRMEGASVRKLAKDFATTQWMIAKLLGSSEVVESAAA
ncbi:Invertase protein [Candidatus Sulfotelmatobacter sp. SbA7]|nr:Invertase protein [Candidatus Sulfotelmatobacter sp. SbA7]